MLTDYDTSCNIDFDDEWIQEDCHWKLRRLVYFTFNVTYTPDNPDDTDDTVELSFYYSLKKHNNTDVRINDGDIINKGNTYTYVLDLSKHLNNILSSPEEYLIDNWLTISATCVIDGHPSFFSKDYYLKLPPKSLDADNIQINYVVDKPGEIKCSWTKPKDENIKGYNIEVYHRLEGQTADFYFKKVGFLKWDETELDKKGNYNKYRIVLDTSLPNSYTPPINNEVVYMNLNPGTELYITDPNKTEFYFTPKYFTLRKFGEDSDSEIKPGDEYKFVIYPYNVYSSDFTYDEDGNINGTDISALISNDGTLSSVRKVPKGIVRVKHGGSWAEGQVWVMTANGWKEAEAIYTKTPDGWVEAK